MHKDLRRKSRNPYMLRPLGPKDPLPCTGTVFAKLPADLLSQIQLYRSDRPTLKPTYKHKITFGSNGKKAGEFDRPLGMAVDPYHGKIHVVEWYNNRVQVFSGAGEFLNTTVKGHPNSFYNAADVAINFEGNLFVVDSGLHRVQVFDPNYNFLYEFGCFGTDNGTIREPSGIAFDKEGNLVIADRNNQRVQVLTPRGGYIRKFKCMGLQPHDGPWSVATDWNNGNIYASTTGYPRGFLRVFTERGVLLRSIGAEGDSALDSSLWAPFGVTVDAESNVIVVDEFNHKVKIFDRDGKFLRILEGAKLNHPRQVILDADGRLIISNSGVHEIQIWE